MDGVTVINSTDIYQLSGWQVLLGIVPLICSAIIYFIGLYKAFKRGSIEDQMAGIVNFHPKYLLILAIGGILSLSLMHYLKVYHPADYVETRYEIKIEDSVSFNEIQNKYILIEEKENTFIVKERE